MLSGIEFDFQRLDVVLGVEYNSLNYYFVLLFLRIFLVRFI